METDNRKEVMDILKGKKIFKVYCEFYIQAYDEDEAKDIVAEDMAYENFFEEHIMIEESELPEGEGIFNN